MARRTAAKRDHGTIQIPYSPRPLQREIHDGLASKRFGALVTHRRFGKTVFGVNHVIREALRCSRPRPQYAYIAPTYTQAKRVAWDYFKFYTDVLDPAINENELRIDFVGQNGARIMLLGADNMDAIRGIYLDGCILDEYGSCRPRIYPKVIRPALADRLGWVVFTGTPQTKNEFFDACELAKKHAETWFYGCYKASSTGIIDSAELELIRRTTPKEEYDREFECSFESPIQGAFYTNEIESVLNTGRLTKVPHDPGHQVELWLDIGMRDATAAWFSQTVGREVRLIRYEEFHVGLPKIIEEIHSYGYQYASYNGPPDLAVREFGTGRSRIETASNLGIDLRITPNVAIADGINAARMFFPLCVFDEVGTREGWEALKNYRRQKNESVGVYTDKPVHDWASHGADAFRYMSLGHRFTTAKRKRERRPIAGLSWI